MLTILTVYVIGIFISFFILGYLNASFALVNRVTSSQGLELFTGQATTRQLALVLIWPMILSYIISYRLLLQYVIYMNNREIKRQMANPPPIPIIVDDEEKTPVVETIPGPLSRTGLN